MSKPSSTSSAESKPNASATPRKPQGGPAQDAARETLESIAFAFVLALLFRTFVAEAFVIPTGSMAPTLFGRNKDVVCAECHYKYQVGASEELNEDGYLIGRIDGSLCPNCRHLNSIRDLPVFKGDRILVNKFPYQLGDPDRWDVIVFRYPVDPQKNYIKRLVGLPGESIRIARGDVYARQGDKGEFQIKRKQNPNKQKVLQQLVYDDQYPPVDLLAKGWPERWNPMLRSEAAGAVDSWNPDAQGWKRDAVTRSFSIDATSEMKWVRYQHFLSDRDDWNGSNDAQRPRPQLITDFCGYNAYTRGREADPDDGRYWVGDLTINCTVEITEVKGSQPRLTFELVEGIRKYRCEIDVTSGTATLLRNDELSANRDAMDVKMASASTAIRGPGRYTITFANVDDRLCLWVNSSWLNSGLIDFGDGAEFQAPAPGIQGPQDADLTPAGFAAQDLNVRVSKLLLQRDIYYRAEAVSNSGFGRPEPELPDLVQIDDLVYEPVQYGELYASKANVITFPALRSDEFFVMGDNSPRSADSRIWGKARHAVNRHAVPRQALLGKAFFIYWPHGIPFLNNGKGFSLLNHSVNGDQRVETYPEYVFPFYPQWWRWKRIQ